MNTTKKLLFAGIVLAILSLPFKFIGISVFTPGFIADTTVSIPIHGYEMVTGGYSATTVVSNRLGTHRVTEPATASPMERTAGIAVVIALLAGLLALVLQARQRVAAAILGITTLMGIVATAYMLYRFYGIKTGHDTVLTREFGIGFWFASLSLLAYLGSAVSAFNAPSADNALGNAGDKLLSAIGRGFNTAAETTARLAEEARLKIRLGSLEKDRERAFTALGMAVYQETRMKADKPDSWKKKISDIDACNASIDKTKKELDQLAEKRATGKTAAPAR